MLNPKPLLLFQWQNLSSRSSSVCRCQLSIGLVFSLHICSLFPQFLFYSLLGGNFRLAAFSSRSTQSCSSRSPLLFCSSSLPALAAIVPAADDDGDIIGEWCSR
eukprot:GHVU01008415.1.p1 GENE.GHVU01008415.1~~GHVU01008415.1.p1  ORF type:complete len:104 (-),score=2.81 GHVU01008415.1:440-751(-)